MGETSSTNSTADSSSDDQETNSEEGQSNRTIQKSDMGTDKESQDTSEFSLVGDDIKQRKVMFASVFDVMSLIVYVVVFALFDVCMFAEFQFIKYQ